MREVLAVGGGVEGSKVVEKASEGRRRVDILRFEMMRLRWGWR